MLFDYYFVDLNINMEIVTDPILRLHLTGGSNSSMFNEHKFSKSLTIKDLKDKLEIIMGVTSNSMKLQVCCITSVFTGLPHFQESS